MEFVLSIRSSLFMALIFAIANVCTSLNVHPNIIGKENYQTVDQHYQLIEPDCREHIKCGSALFVAKCKKTCTPSYYYCSSPGAAAVPEVCPRGQVFNTDLAYPYCVAESSCPYNPGWIVTPTPKPTKPTTETTTTPKTTKTTTKTTKTTPKTTKTTTKTTTATTTKTTTATPTNTPTTTATPTPTTPGCIDSLTCPAAGDYPKCPTCVIDYFHCENPGAKGIPRKCESFMVFNPDETTCVPVSDC